MAEIRLSRFLAQAGIASRRGAETLITDGVVQVNGEAVTVLGSKVDPASDKVTVDGKAVYPQDRFYVVLNKPKGCVSTVSDPEGRTTVMDYVQGVPAAIKPVGRLDYHSEGVLLLTNDGELAAALTSPRKHVEKTYHVKLSGTLTDGEIAKLRRGVKLDDGRVTKPAEVDRLKHKSKHDWLVITLTEGRNRQIHRMMASIRHEVTKIQRVAFAGIDYHGLRVGDARELTANELKTLRASVKLEADPRAEARGKWKSKREDSDIPRRAKRKKLAEKDEARAALEQKAEASGRGTKSAGGAKAAPTRRGSAPKGGAKPAAKRGGKPAPKRGAKPAAKPAAKRGAKPAAKRGGKPAAKRGARPAPKRGGKPAAKPAAKRGGKPAPKRGGKPAAKPAAKRGGKPAPKRGAKPAPKRGGRAATKKRGR